MTERDTAAHRPKDRIEIRRTTVGDDGEQVVDTEHVMNLPGWASRFTGNAPSGLLPEGLQVVDTRNADPRRDDPHVIVSGERVDGERVIPLTDGVGAIELAAGVEVVVNAPALTSKLQRQSRTGGRLDRIPRPSRPTVRRTGW
jgi:hypothetical protein